MRAPRPLLAVVIAAAAWSCACRFGAAPKEPEQDVPTAAATRGEFRVTIEEVGVLRATVAQEIKAQGWGKVAKVLPEGTKVKAGDPVLWIDTTELDQALQRLDADLDETKSEMDKQIERMSFQVTSSNLDLEVSTANLDFEQKRLASAHKAAEDAARQRGLGLISQQAADRAAEQLRSAELSAQKADLAHQGKVAEIQGQEHGIAVDRQQAQRTWQQTKDRREDIARQIEHSTLRAPGPGEVFLVKQRFRGAGNERGVRVGDQVGPWMGALVQLPDRSLLEVRSQVDEALISKVVPGLPVDVRVTAVEGLVLPGRVKSLAVLAIARSGSEGGGFSDGKQVAIEQIVFPTIIELTAADARAQPGMTVGVSYILQVLADAVSVPDEAVFGDSHRPVVFVRAGKGYEERAVTLGATSHGRVVIAEGLAGGEDVYLGDPRSAKASLDHPSRSSRS